MPIRWGDGGDQRYVVGTRRGSGGRSLIRLVMNTDRLVNYRVKPVWSPAIYAAMGQPLNDGTGLSLYSSREDAQQAADTRKWLQTRQNHLGLALDGQTSAMHNADEMCEFCDGRDAALAGAGEDANPYPVPGTEPEHSVDWWSTDHGMWRCGWLTEKHRGIPFRIDDLGVRHIALLRRKMSRDAAWLARVSQGRTAAELESDGIPRARLRLVRGDHPLRPLDGVVHAWLDADDRVVRTQFC
ncbi:hypothetical protein AB0G04_02625 [Actinoplanes sp. NPDC023801]|uniref:hypothetical protein n=1 Tax=Actinoplanes sp. NPDC023801 TaxID=3154595 RepID=UPI0033CD8F36